MATKLKRVRIREISLCSFPANPEARVAILKRDEAPAPITGEAMTFPRTEHHMSEMSDFAKAEASLDALVRKRRERHDDESEAVAMTKVLETPEGGRLYRDMVFAKDFAFAKRSMVVGR